MAFAPSERGATDLSGLETWYDVGTVISPGGVFLLDVWEADKYVAFYRMLFLVDTAPLTFYLEQFGGGGTFYYLGTGVGGVLDLDYSNAPLYSPGNGGLIRIVNTGIAFNLDVHLWYELLDDLP
jgi:hypothetical protein